jgi:DNA-binding CsgD family transcriptional regulator
MSRLSRADVLPTFAGVTDHSPAPLDPSAARPDPDDEEGTPDPGAARLPLLLIVVLTLMAAGATVDLLLDRPRSWRSAHVIFEAATILLSLGSAVLLWRGWWRASRALGRTRLSLAATRRTLAERQAERDAWRRSAERALAGLGEAIDRQFGVWHLTPAEREVALLVLQGHGHKQIAARTRRSERTIRQHAAAVYEKAGLGGRAELAAFFLQDLVVPSDSSSSPAGG